MLLPPGNLVLPTEKLNEAVKTATQTKQEPKFMVPKGNESFEKVTGELFLSLLLQVSENIFIIFKSSSSLGQNLSRIPRELDDHMQTFQARPTTVHSFSKTQMISQETELTDLQNTRYYPKERSK